MNDPVKTDRVAAPETARRRSVRGTALLLGALALAVYLTFIALSVLR